MRKLSGSNMNKKFNVYTDGSVKFIGQCELSLLNGTSGASRMLERIETLVLRESLPTKKEKVLSVPIIL